MGSVRFIVEGPQGPEGHEHAGIWSGSAESWVSLNPPLVPPPDRSVGYSTDGVQQGGFVKVDWDHAGIWSGSAETWTDLHPPGATRSTVFGVYDGRQVGFATIEAIHAALWTGTVESYVDLNPPGAVRSWGYGVWGDEQVGMATVSDLPELVHASLWRGSPDSWVDLHPQDLYPTGWSYARAVCGGWQVGWVLANGAVGSPRASLWHGTADSYVDLHALLPDGYDGSQAWGIDVAGNEIWVVGYAHNQVAGRDEAVMWYVPEPGTLSLLVVGGLVVAGGRIWRKRPTNSPKARPLPGSGTCMCRLLKCALLLVLLLVPSRDACADARYTVIDLGGFDPTQKGAAFGINNAGQVVGWAFLETAPNVYSMRAFMWEGGSIHDLGARPGEERSCAPSKSPLMGR